jgi:hypothetical protein
MWASKLLGIIGGTLLCSLLDYVGHVTKALHPLLSSLPHFLLGLFMPPIISSSSYVLTSWIYYLSWPLVIILPFGKHAPYGFSNTSIFFLLLPGLFMPFIFFCYELIPWTCYLPLLEIEGAQWEAAGARQRASESGRKMNFWFVVVTVRQDCAIYPCRMYEFLGVLPHLYACLQVSKYGIYFTFLLPLLRSSKPLSAQLCGQRTSNTHSLW